MTRELKLSLIIGFSLVLLVAVLISDHLGRGERIVLAGAPDELPAGLVIAGHSPWQGGEVQDALERMAQLPAAQAPTGPLGGVETRVSDGGSVAMARTDRREEPVAAEGDVHGFPPGMFEPVREEPRGPIVLDQSGGVGIVPRLGGDRPALASVSESRQTPIVPAQTAWYTVAQGETLFGIAAKHLGSGHRWREIAELNADRVGKDGAVRAGVRIRLPVTGSQPPPRREPEPMRVAQNTSRETTLRGGEAERRQPGAVVRTYVVEQNDTLGHIAQSKLGTVRRLDELRALNQDVLKGRDVIRPGMVLRLPAG